MARKIKAGDTVKITDLKGMFPSWIKKGKLRKGKILVVRRVKESGGLLFEGCDIGFNLFGVECGLLPHRVTLVKRKKK